MKSKEKKKNISDLLLQSDGAVSVLVVLLGFLCGTILILAVGRNPMNMYKSIFQSLTGYNIDRGVWNIRYVGEWLNLSVPYILCGLAMAFAARTGLFNIGGEGQYIVGLTVAQVIALLGPEIPVLHWVIAIIGAIAIGAVWGGIVGFLKAKYEVSEVVATIMLNYIALYLSRIVIMAIPGTNTYKTVDFPVTASLRVDFLSVITNGSTLNLGIFLAVIAVIIYWFLMEKTNVGFGLRATGFNKEAARYGGISVVTSVVISMAVAGAFAGLGGGIVALGSFRYGRVLSGMDNYGFTGIAVALVGNNTAIGTLLSGLLFGLLAAAQPLMQSRQIPKEITFIIQGLIVVFIAIRSGLRIYLNWRAKKALEKQVLAENLEGGK
ncbi:MAG: ABC transporter permease [Candidatus Treponema excrementipullorum]|nr:ABC transporter permease [Spirochaetia bacterium]MDD7011470.1 ABC transporter permease [Candidatus Treponema excrementipullorum]MDY2755387.1 ABC transporter permease [Candidatus Treponema excrementipullorum]MDY4466586.1 ABC transporter permease [Candidatus Treponema excrementipullorum]